MQLRRRSVPMPARAVVSAPADQLDALADQVNRLRIENHNPERFHIERNDIAVTLRRMARTARASV